MGMFIHWKAIQLYQKIDLATHFARYNKSSINVRDICVCIYNMLYNILLLFPSQMTKFARQPGSI